jgi:hypothetical protein
VANPEIHREKFKENIVGEGIKIVFAIDELRQALHGRVPGGHAPQL